MNDLMIKDEIENMIYEIRGKQVMLASDLARLYNCKNGTKDINKAVKRNIDRFPEDFYFKLTVSEMDSIAPRFQSGTLKIERGKNIKYLPHVFTEQGVAMLATVLHTEIASEISVKIMRTFIKLRKYINYEKNILLNMENKLIEHDNKLLDQNERIDILFDKLETKEKINHIFFEGQIYDAYSLLIDILNKAKKEIIIIDNYIDKNLLDILKKINKNILIITNKINETDLTKYNEQYNNIEIIKSNKYHDRFIIIDKETLYHSGASLKDLGKNVFL